MRQINCEALPLPVTRFIGFCREFGAGANSGLITSCISASVLLTACSSTPEVAVTPAQQQKIDAYTRVVDESPSWFKTPPAEEGQLTGVGTGTSTDLQLAIDKAALQARRQVAEKLAGKLSLKTSDHIKESGSVSSHFERTISESAIEADISGYVVKEQKVSVSGTGYRAWVLIASPVTQVATKETYSPKEEFQANKAYRELEADIKKAKAPKEEDRNPYEVSPLQASPREQVNKE